MYVNMIKLHLNTAPHQAGKNPINTGDMEHLFKHFLTSLFISPEFFGNASEDIREACQTVRGCKIYTVKRHL
jgi:hypothetical protein